MFRVGDLDIVIQLDITGSDNARAFLAEGYLGIVPAAHFHGHAFKIQKNLNDVFLNTFDRAVLVQHAVDLCLGNGTARH